MLLTDVFMIERMEVLEEGSGSKTMKVRGVFQRAEESNNNGRVYPSGVLSKQVDKLQSMISERRLCGELDHPQNDSVKLSNASHLVTKLEMKGNEVIGEAEILNTPAGLTAKALINGGVKIGISSRGMGTLSEDSKGQKIVNEDFNLITFDLVADPSTRGAHPMVSESKTYSFVNESTAKLQKESNFYVMLKNKFDSAYGEFITEKKGLIGNQKNIDVNNNQVLDAEDFALLRKKGGKKKGGKKKVTTGARGLLKKVKKKLAENVIPGPGNPNYPGSGGPTSSPKDLDLSGAIKAVNKEKEAEDKKLAASQGRKKTIANLVKGLGKAASQSMTPPIGGKWAALAAKVGSTGLGALANVAAPVVGAAANKGFELAKDQANKGTEKVKEKGMKKRGSIVRWLQARKLRQNRQDNT